MGTNEHVVGERKERKTGGWMEVGCEGEQQVRTNGERWAARERERETERAREREREQERERFTKGGVVPSGM